MATVSLAPAGRGTYVSIEQAFDAYRRGDWAVAERMFAEILQASPHHFDALHLLGVLRTGQGQCAEAVRLIKRALKINPHFADARYNLGVALQRLGKHREAVACYRQVLNLAPQHLGSCNNLGIALHLLGHLDEAVKVFQRTLAIQPNFAEGHYNLGRVLTEMERREEAVASYQEALRLKPDYVDALNNLGGVYEALSRYPEAVDVFTRALRLAPVNAEIQNNLGAVLGRLIRHEEAIEHLRTALSLRPDYAEAHNNLGNELRWTYRYDEACIRYRQAIALKPDFAEAYCNLGGVLMVLHQCQEALECYRKALEIQPDFPAAHSDMIFTLDYLSGSDACVGIGFREHQEERRRWYERHARRLSPMTDHANEKAAGRKLRIGYSSPYLIRNSAGVSLFLPIIRNHDRTRFEVHIYSDVRTRDDITEAFQQTDSIWHDTVGLTDAVLAEKIRADGIDVLVDLSGHSTYNRLLTFARKPAPIQISAWGHPTGTGLPTMDYLFGDPVAIPPEVRPFFAETIYDLPCFLGYDPPAVAPPVAPLPASSSSSLTFGCLNRLSKLSDRSVALWSQLLGEMPDARLLLKDTQLSDPNECRRVEKAFAEHGIAGDRLILLGSTSHLDHLAVYGKVDIALDPFPQSGGVSTFESLWMGVPAVALVGPSVSGRGAASIMTALGLGDWVAATENEYLAIARRKAADLGALASLRGALRPLMASSPLGDAKKYCRAVEEAYRHLWSDYCRS